MYLGPHHFQAQSRYFEDSVHFALSNVSFAPYGLGGVQLDQEALRNGTLSLIHARGIFPDGLIFQMPDADPLPDARNITDLFSPVRESVNVHLAIPPRTEDGVNCTLERDGEPISTRYVAETFALHDENTGRDEKLVNLGRKNIALLLDSELTPGTVSLPIARVARDGSGHFIFDPGFIPPPRHRGERAADHDIAADSGDHGRQERESHARQAGRSAERGRLVEPGSRQLLVPAHGERGPGAAAAPVFRPARPSGAAVPGTIEAGRGAVHVRLGIAPENAAALRP